MSTGVRECVNVLLGKKKEKEKKRKYLQYEKVHLAQELDDVHARPSFVFPGQHAELHSL